jgi:hypothetical protein
VATPTLANPFSLHPRCPKPQPGFRVFPTGEAEYSWRIAALASNQTVSRHKSLAYAIRKCTRLNEHHREALADSLKTALSGFPDVNTYRAYYEGVGHDGE